MDNTRATCAHYDDGTSDPENGMFSRSPGTCLFNTRNWSASCTPKRCSDCPAAAVTGFDEDHGGIYGENYGDRSVKRSHRAEGRNFVD